MIRAKHFIYENFSQPLGRIEPTILMRFTHCNKLIPFYHTISNDYLPHIKHLYRIKNVKEFENDLNFLLRYYQPVDYFEFTEKSLDSSKSQKPYFLLTFDDGLSEFYHVIAPILLRKGIPAICFLNSKFIDNKALFFRYKLSLIINRLSEKPKLTKHLKSFFPESRNIKNSILSLQYSHTDIIDQIANLIDIRIDEFLLEHQPYLSTNQIKELIQKGFQFGSHSIDHPEYQYININAQIEQTKSSMSFINEKFKLNYKIFSFPFTDHNVSRQFFKTVFDEKIVDHTFGSAGYKLDSEPNNFQRLSFEQSNLSAKQIHNTELLYYMLLKAFNKNKIIRK